MKLLLTYSQRLNLHALMGAQRASLDDLRLLWRLQDQIALSADEKKTINYRTQAANAQQVVMWDIEKEPAAEGFEFNSDEFARLSKILKEWQPGFLISADRQWLEPLMEQFDIATPGGKPDGKAAAGLGQVQRN